MPPTWCHRAAAPARGRARARCLAPVCPAYRRGGTGRKCAGGPWDRCRGRCRRSQKSQSRAWCGPGQDVAGDAGLEIFQRVVDQIGEDLLHRQPVADDVGQRLDADLRLRLGGLMRDRRTMPSISSRVSIATGWNSRRPSRVRLRIAEISRSILPIDDLMKPSASVKSCESCLSAPSSAGSALRSPLSGACGAADCWRGRASRSA